MNRLVAIETIADINPKSINIDTDLNTPVTFLPMAALSEDGYINYQEERVFSEVNKGYNFFQEGDVLLAKITPCMENGKAAHATNLIHKIGFGSTEFHVLRPGKNVDGRYLFYMIWNPFFRKVAQNNMTGSAGQKRVPTSFIKRYKIPLPPLETQKKIADALDKIQKFIGLRKKQIEKWDELIKAIFLKMFKDINGDKYTLSEICEINPTKNKIKHLNNDFEVSFLPMSAVSENGKINLQEVRKIGEVKKNFTYFKEGDVLFAKITPCMENGKGAIAKNLVNKIGFGSTEFHVLRPKKDIKSEWLYTLTSLSTFRKIAEKSMTGSAGQRRVPMYFFDQFKVLVPPLDLQNKFAALVEKTEKQKELMEKSLSAMETLFNGIAQKAFRGELFN